LLRFTFRPYNIKKSSLVGILVEPADESNRRVVLRGRKEVVGCCDRIVVALACKRFRRTDAMLASNFLSRKITIPSLFLLPNVTCCISFSIIMYLGRGTIHIILVARSDAEEIMRTLRG
jgi:hypothetical protein